MELKMKPYQLPENISFNFEELKQELTAKVEMYKTLVYTDDQIAEAKKDRANLNRLKKSLNDERIRLEREYLIPFNKFKAEINEIIRIIDEPVAVIDRQVKEAEEKKKADKLAAITGYWKSCEKPFDIPFEKIMDQKWLNASVSLKSVYGAIDVLLETITKDLFTLRNLTEFSFEAVEVYKTTLDLGKAIQEGQRLADIQKRKAEQERLAAERKAEAERLKAEAANAQKAKEVVKTPEGGVYVQDDDKQGFTYHEPVTSREWVRFKAFMTEEDGYALKAFFESRNIEFAAI